MDPKQIDGPKLKKLREKAGYTQEHLAQLSNVGVRTLQRAEKGERLTPENIADISAALKVPARELYAAAIEPSRSIAEPPLKDPSVVVLRRTTSARSIMDLMVRCYRADIDCDIEANGDNVEILAALVEALEAQAPDPTPEWGPAVQKPSLTDKIKAVADLNNKIARALDAGAFLFVGNYVLKELVPHYLHDEGVWVTSHNQEEEPVRIGKLMISDNANDRIVIDHPAYIPF